MGRGADARDSRGLDRADDGFKCWTMQKKWIRLVSKDQTFTLALH